MPKWKKVFYWICTVWLALGLVASGVQQLMHLPMDGALAPPGTIGIAELGYPLYFLTLIGVWKLLGTIVLLSPRLPLVKEWAYAGIFFLLTGALFSHVAAGHGAAELFPAGLLLVLSVVSWWLRPVGRRVVVARG